jgi:hypothetical protein
MLRRAAALAALAVVADTAGAAPQFALRISGAFTASTARTVAGERPQCTVRQGTLRFESAAMLIGGGPAVARAEITLVRFRGYGLYSAVQPRIAYGRTPVQIASAATASTGTASAFFLARSGYVRIRSPRELRGGVTAPVAGTVAATLAHGSRRIRLTGTWSCVAAHGVRTGAAVPSTGAEGA